MHLGPRMQPVAVEWPALCFSKQNVLFMPEERGMTTCTKAALKKGNWFDGLGIVDRGGREFLVKRATLLHGVGPFWGYNLLFGRVVRVALEYELVRDTVPLAEVKSRIYASFRAWHGWAAGGDLGEVRLAVKKASCLDDLMKIIGDAGGTVHVPPKWLSR